MKKILIMVTIIMVTVLLNFVLCSCSKTKLDEEPLARLKAYFDSIERDNYEEAYSILHPMLRGKVSITEYINNLKKSQEVDGDILAVVFDGIVKHVKGDYVYRVTLVRNKKVTEFDMEMLKENDNKWYLNAVKGISERKRDNEEQLE